MYNLCDLSPIIEAKIVKSEWILLDKAHILHKTMSPPKKSKPNQPSIMEMFGKTSSQSHSSSNDVADESKQNVLIDMVVSQVKNENGTEWTFLFDFDIHFIASGSQQIDIEDSVEIENASSSRASSAPTSRSGTPMETEDDCEDFDDDSSSIGSSG